MTPTVASVLDVPVVVDVSVASRTRGNLAYAPFENVNGSVPTPGTTVRVRETESGTTGLGIVTEVKSDTRLVYVAVAWAELVSA